MNIQAILSYCRSAECPICLDPINLSTRKITICNHVFHELCLNQIVGHTCPLCRHVISEPPLSPFTLQWGLQYDSESEYDSETDE